MALNDGRDNTAREEDKAPYGRCGDNMYIKAKGLNGCGAPLDRDSQDNGACLNWPDCLPAQARS